MKLQPAATAHLVTAITLAWSPDDPASCRSGAAGHAQRRTAGRVDALITNLSQRQRQLANSPLVESDQRASALGLAHNVVDLAFARVQ